MFKRECFHDVIYVPAIGSMAQRHLLVYSLLLALLRVSLLITSGGT